jgi:hypothetical protein
MENRKIVLIVVSLALSQTLNLTFPGRVFGYEVQAHAGITKEAVAFYNQHFPERLVAPEEAKKIIEGSILEDDAPRWFNHYYDPIYNRGLTHPLAIVATLSSKAWARDARRQTSIVYNPAENTTLANQLAFIDPEKLEETDFTWERAIKDYIKGDKPRAFRALGQVIHLIEDASVPDHTRNDPHIAIGGHGIGGEGSPYELWTMQFNEQNTHLLPFLVLKQPIILDSLDAYFDSMANYSNRNFYSKDTIDIPEYAEPKPDYFMKIGDEKFAFKRDLENGDYRLSAYTSDKDSKSSFLSEEIISLQDTNSFILRDYWERLAPKAVQHVAGVINLFFKEVERLKDDPEFQPKERITLMGQIRAIFKKWFNNESKTPETLGGLAQVAEVVLDQRESIPEPEFAPPVSVKTPTPTLPLPLEHKREEIKTAPKFLPDGDQNLSTTVSPTPVIATLTSILPLVEREDACEFSSSAAIARGEVMLNEIAWAGTVTSASNEWIELKNLSVDPVDISGWSLLDQGGQIKAVFPPGARIPAKSFWLLERTDDASVPNVAADYIYKGDLKNSDEGLRLYDKNCVLRDEAMAAPEWPAGSAAERRSMERRNDLSWMTFIGNGDGTVLGTPRAENSGLAIGIASYSAPQPAPALPPPAENLPTASPGNSATHVVISEVMVGVEGNAEYEFVELYNPTDAPVSLAGWSLKKKTSSGSETNLVSAAAFAGTIAPKSFFLIAHNGYDGARRPDLRYSANSQNLAYTNNAAVLYDATGAKVDEVSWAEIKKGESLERRAVSVVGGSGGCVSATTDGGYLGNGCDTDSAADFDGRATPEPQNSQNLPEPRTQAAASDFGAFFYPQNMRAVFRWATTTDARGSTSVTYIFDGVETSEIGFSRPFTEIGREYNFSLLARDREGLLSATSTVATSVPSYLKNVAWYLDPRDANGTIIDLYYNQHPFLPNYWQGPAWKALVIYKNVLPRAQEDLQTFGNWHPANLADVLTIKYARADGDITTRSSLILADSADKADGGGGLRNVAYKYENLEDGLVRLRAPGSPTTADFLTFDYYDFYESGGGNQSLRFFASDLTKRYFTTDAVNVPPDPPGSLNFDAYATTSKKLLASFRPAKDPDGLDAQIRYQYSVASSTSAELLPIGEPDWWGVPPIEGSERRGADAQLYYVMGIPVEEGIIYRLSLRAIDGLGATSSIAVYPLYTVPVTGS